MLRHCARHHSFIEGVGKLSSIIKSISLDPQTAELAANIPNFSRFVRECLIRHHLAEDGQWVQCKRLDDDSRLCIPTMKPRCMKCWPAGPPDHEAWMNYVRRPSNMKSKYAANPNPDYLDHVLVQENAEEVNIPLFSFEDMVISGNSKPARNHSKPGRLARLMGRLWPK